MEAVSVRLLTPQQLQNMSEDLAEQGVLDVGEISEIDGFEDFNQSYVAPQIFYSKVGTDAVKLTGGPPRPRARRPAHGRADPLSNPLPCVLQAAASRCGRS